MGRICKRPAAYRKVNYRRLQIGTRRQISGRQDRGSRKKLRDVDFTSQSRVGEQKQSKQKHAQDARDTERINNAAERLNAEAEDVLGYQTDQY